MRTLTKSLLALAVLFVIVCAGMFVRAAAPARQPALMDLVGKPAPDFTLKDTDGNSVKLSDLKGSVVVLDFWATWCGPCKQSLPLLNKVYDQHKAKGLKVYTVDLKEAVDLVKTTMKDRGYTMPCLLDTDAAVAKLYKVSGIPSTFLVGADGNIKWAEEGFDGNQDALNKQIGAILK
jgi:peroxiredoxin